MDEFGLIDTYFKPLARDFGGSLGLSDDAAILTPPPGRDLVVTKDAINEGVHFLGNEDPALIARKLLRVNLSDLAAMGAAPLCYFLALMLPRKTPERWVARFAEGLKQDQEEFGISLAGGDTTSNFSQLGFSITAIGAVPSGRAITRSGAKPGDGVYVSGTLGDSALGLGLLQQRIKPSLPEAQRAFLEQRYFLPQPRLALGQALAGIASACIDISDGLAQDLGHLCAASGCAADIDAPNLPLSDAARPIIAAAPEERLQALCGGDDYELLFTVPPQRASSVPAGCTRIGVIGEGSGVTVRDERGEPMMLPLHGFRHFF